MSSILIETQAQARLDDLQQQALSEQHLNKGTNQLRQALASILLHSANKLNPQLSISTTQC